MGVNPNRQVRIQSDGTGQDTTITLPDGTVIPGVISADIFMEAREVNRVSFTVLAPRHDIHATVEEITVLCQCCGETISHNCERTMT